MNQRTRIPTALALALAAASGAVAGAAPQAGTEPTSTATVYGLAQRGHVLLRFQAGNPMLTEAILPIAGVQTGERLIGIDFRPSTGDLLALSNASRLYRIDLGNGVATPLGAGPFSPALAGAEFGFDFNPVPDRIRVVSDAEQNLRLHPVTGAVAGTDSALAYAAGDPNFAANPALVASAYTSSFAGATSTTLYGIDANLDVLVRQGSVGGAPVSPNSGQLFTVGALGFDANLLSGFDVSPYGGALASLMVPGGTRSMLFTVDLDTGAATMIGSIGTAAVRDIAIQPPTPRILGLTTDNRLVSFKPGSPDSIASSLAILGLQPGEVLLGLDVRPSTGDLVAVGSSSRLYRLDRQSGQATAIGAGPFSPALSGAEFGVDFNPVPDRLRVVSDAEQNLRLNPNSGAVAGVDTPLAFAAGDSNAGADPILVACAYTNDFPGASTTTLFGLDAGLDLLVRQGSVDGAPVSPNSGQLFTIGALGLDAGALAGFDISPFGGVFAALSPVGAALSSLYTVNLTTGAATLVGSIAASAPLRDLAIEPPATPRVFAVTGSNQLLSFAPGTPGALASSVPITGLQSMESILGIDFRPSTGALVGLGSTSRLYAIQPDTGVATQIGSGTFSTPLAGLQFGADFNPVPDRVRVISDADQNLRLLPNTGALAAVDAMLAYAAGDPNASADPNAVACAYSANFGGSFRTTLYAIDSSLDLLVLQGSQGGSPVSPNTGQLFTIGSLGFDTSDRVGFDISFLGGAFAALTPAAGGPSQLFQVNLATGTATPIGSVGSPEEIRAIALR